MWWCSSSCISRLGGLFREDWSRKQANAKHSGGHFECVPSVCMFVRGGQTSAGDARHAGVCGPWGDQLWARGPGEWHVEHRSHLLLSVSWRKEMQLWILCGSESCNTGRPFRFLCGTERKWNARICLYLLLIYPFYMCWILWSNLKITKKNECIAHLNYVTDWNVLILFYKLIYCTISWWCCVTTVPNGHFRSALLKVGTRLRE